MTTKIEMVPVDLIDPHPHNPRRDLGDLTELADSIKSQGIQQNLVLVRSVTNRYMTKAEQERFYGPGRTIMDAAFTVVIGHRRLAAAKMAGLTEVPAVIRQDTELPAAAQIELMLLENLQREGISPVEEAEGYQQLLDLGVKPKDIAKMTGRSGSTIHARLQLLKLPEDAREKVHREQASLEDAAEVAKFEKHPDELDRVTKALGTSNFDWEIKQARQRVARDEALAPLYAEAERLGAVRGSYDWQKYDAFGHGETVEEVAAAAPFPEGAIYYPATYSPYIYIAAPKPAEEVSLRERNDPNSPEARAARDEAYRVEQERQEAIKAEGEQAWESREEFVVAFCGRKRILAKDGLAIIAAVAPLVITQDDVWLDPSDLAEWLGLGDEDWDGVQDLMPAFDKACPSLDRSLCLLVLLHLSCRRPTWSHAYQDHALVALYGLLEQLGYPVSDAERSRITPPADGESGEDSEDVA